MVTPAFIARAEISRLTAVIDSGTPAPLGVVGGMHCAPAATVYVLRFMPGPLEDHPSSSPSALARTLTASS